MNTQPEALRLAEQLEAIGLHGPVAAELRRLHAALVESEKWRDRDEARAANAERERDIAEAQRDALLEALKWIADHDLLGTDLMVCGHMAHGFIGRARAAVSAFEGKKT